MSVSINDLYFTDPLIGEGLPVLTKYGAMAKSRLIEILTAVLLKKKYVPIASPHISNSSLFTTSGHYPYYKDSMFPAMQHTEGDSYNPILLKPMNCPFHILAYRQMGVVSYRDLPVKFFEFGQVYRDESSGSLNGLFRVKSFVQDDGHIFCKLDDIPAMVDENIRMIKAVLELFDMTCSMKISIRGKESSKYIGTEAAWDYAENALRNAIPAELGPPPTDIGGAAFYGPKIDFIALDKMGREWQLGTIQLDFALPERFKLKYISGQGKEEMPVIIHRALLGSIERFLAVLTESGGLPDFLNPFNFGIVYLSPDQGDDYYLDGVVNMFNDYSVYPTVNYRPKNLSGAIRDLNRKGINNICVIGRAEVAGRSLMINNVKTSSECVDEYARAQFGLPRLKV